MAPTDGGDHVGMECPAFSVRYGSTKHRASRKSSLLVQDPCPAARIDLGHNCGARTSTAI